MANGFRINFDMAVRAFFDKPITDALSKKAKQVLSRFGGLVRTISRRSIKPGKRKTPSELTPEERQRLNHRFRLWAVGRIKDKPRPPSKPSEPGQPPRRKWDLSPLRLILFSYDPTEQSVTIGPVAFGKQKPGEATEALEYGGPSTGRGGRRVNIRARPFMTPAFDKSLPRLQEWRNAL